MTAFVRCVPAENPVGFLERSCPREHYVRIIEEKKEVTTTIEDKVVFLQS